VAVAEGGRGASDGPAQTTYVLRLMLLACLRARATDLHVEPKEGTYRARMRVDGVMVDAAVLPPEVGGRLVAAIKVVADIDPSQKTVIQEGSFSTRLPGGPKMPYGATRRVDFRISLAPAVFGQKLVLRILDPTTAPGNLSDLQLLPTVEKELRWAIEQEAGMVLVCGPTGSGKTSTLYALIRSLDLGERNVTTIEDPVEIQIAGATQIPVDEEKGKSFSALLRSVLRQDPDVSSSAKFATRRRPASRCRRRSRATSCSRRSTRRIRSARCSGCWIWGSSRICCRRGCTW
jgi:type II secretory ATPase GspE/PulE/Tfp pilus assembly ATPase PilB-like protein